MIRMIALAAAMTAWIRALAGPLLLAAAAGSLLVFILWLDIDQAWPAAIAGALLVGLAIVWAGKRAIAHAEYGRTRSAPTDGEGESL